MRVGILAVQGDFEAHAEMLRRLGAESVFVRTPDQLANLRAIILPGGESTTQLRFLRDEGLFEALQKFSRDGAAFFGTCAGAILLAKEVRNPAQDSLGLADFVAVRNAYGRQLASEVRKGTTRLRTEPLEMVFIRAPVIEQPGPGVEILAESGGRPVLVRQGLLLAATFHPELSGDTLVHEYFLSQIVDAS